MVFFLGIDGGGTKTRCLLGDERAVFATAISGGSNIVRLGEAKAKEALAAAIQQVTDTANIFPNQIRAICIGAAGAARPEIAAKIRGIVAGLIPEIAPDQIEVIGDTEIALEAAFGLGPGIIAIAGTGSIVFGRDNAGHRVRAGGWGFAISDEGSGHWIGRRAVSAILSANDEACETVLTAMVLQAWRLDTLDKLVQQANATPPPEFPRLFPVVLRAADEGDSVARGILVDAAAKLAALATTVVRRLAALNQSIIFPVATTGSVFRQSSTVREVFYNTLKASFAGIEVKQELTDPVEGALARARRM
jgi:glucosamine kinase